MGCIYEDRSDGTCTLATDSEGEFDKAQAQQGCDDCGNCCVTDDPDPSVSCDAYESDWQCYECGVDLNVDDCECEEDEE